MFLIFGRTPFAPPCYPLFIIYFFVVEQSKKLISLMTSCIRLCDYARLFCFGKALPSLEPATQNSVCKDLSSIITWYLDCLDWIRNRDIQELDAEWNKFYRRRSLFSVEAEAGVTDLKLKWSHNCGHEKQKPKLEEGHDCEHEKQGPKLEEEFWFLIFIGTGVCSFTAEL